MFYLMTHILFTVIWRQDIWFWTILIVRKENRCRHIGYSYRLTARVLLYAPSHRQDSTYHGLCYTSRGALAGMRNSYWVHPMKDRSDDPSHHERTLLPQSHISLPWRIDPTTHRTMSERSYHGATSRSHEGSIRRPIAPRANALTMELHVARSYLEQVDEPGEEVGGGRWDVVETLAVFQHHLQQQQHRAEHQT